MKFFRAAFLALAAILAHAFAGETITIGRLPRSADQAGVAAGGECGEIRVE